MNNDTGKSAGKLILIVVIIFILFSALTGGGGGPFSLIFGFMRFFFWTGFILCLIILAITAAVIWFTMKDNKFRGKHDPPNITPKAARDAAAKNKAAKAGNAGDAANAGNAGDPSKAGNAENGGAHGASGASGASGGPGNTGGPGHAGAAVPENFPTADRSKTYEKTPEGIMQMLSDYRIDYILGSVAKDACKQKERLTAQQESYRRLVERRFGKGTLSAEKYLSVEKSSNEAMHNAFLRITNRMEAFDTKEYMHFKSGAYKTDSIPDHVQEQRQEIYEENLRYMRECLADNEHILAGMDRLMLKLADSETADEHSITEEIEELERQLAYYRKQIVS